MSNFSTAKDRWSCRTRGRIDAKNAKNFEKERQKRMRSLRAIRLVLAQMELQKEKKMHFHA